MKTLQIIFAIMLLMTCSANADVRKITFENKEGQDVDDLHIVFTRGETQWDNNAPGTTFTNVRHNNGNSDYNFWGVNIPPGGTATLTFSSPGEIKIKEWWWTKGGNALKNGDEVGKTKKGDTGDSILAMNGPAAGNGLIKVTAGGQVEFFNTIPGLMPQQTIMAFANFIQTEFNMMGDPKVYIRPTSPQSLHLASNRAGDSTDQIKIEILQMDLQTITPVIPIRPSVLSLRSHFEGSLIPIINIMEGDYINVTFRNPAPPFSILSTTTCYLDSTGAGEACTFGIPDGQPFFIQLSHRNSIETWSANPAVFNAKQCSYNFTMSQNSAFGMNLKQVGNRFCTYSGDVNQDGTIDGTDIGLIDNDAYNFATGYLATDLTGDEAIDATDIAIADNNATNFISVIRP